MSTAFPTVLSGRGAEWCRLSNLDPDGLLRWPRVAARYRAGDRPCARRIRC